jgi:ATP adenylyltransferase
VIERLRERARQVAVRAHREGQLVRLASERHAVLEAGLEFTVRILEAQDRKDLHTRRQRKRKENPFLPPDPALLVGAVSASHVCILNKFMVVPDHLLIVTRRFVPQDEPLDSNDFDTLFACLREIDGLGFYNAGREAGASQPHKHLQLVPAAPAGARFPLEPTLEAAGAGGPRGDAALPFRLAAQRLSAPEGGDAFEAYCRLRRQLGLTPGTPYNLLATRELVALFPRSREHWDGCSMNALTFAGSLLVRSPEQLERVRREGPLSVLSAVGVPARQ